MTVPTKPAWMRAEQFDRALGAMVGLAIGDALGTTLEFTRRDQLPHHSEITGGGPFSLKPGQWTDDTAMALALADSLAARKRFDAKDLMKRFVSWHETGEYSCTGKCFDIGSTTKSALSYFKSTGKPLAGSTADDTSGNGGIMRLAPAVLHGLRSERILVDTARMQSQTTHASPACLDAAEGMARIMRDLILRAPGAPARYEVDNWTPSDDGIRAVIDGSHLFSERRYVVSSGHVTATLHAALWALARTKSFEEAVVLAVNLGHDADTVGAVTGQIAGASYGLSAIPKRWLDILAWRQRLEDVAVRLVEKAPARQTFMARLLSL